MELTAFQREWRQLADHFRLTVCIPYQVKLGDVELEVPVLLRDFAAANGMLLVTDDDLPFDISDQLDELGFGFSCLDDPVGDEPIDEESVVDMLRDWGWSGTGAPPRWYDVT